MAMTCWANLFSDDFSLSYDVPSDELFVVGFKLWYKPETESSEFMFIADQYTGTVIKPLT